MYLRTQQSHTTRGELIIIPPNPSRIDSGTKTAALRQHRSPQLEKIRCSKTSSGIPSASGVSTTKSTSPQNTKRSLPNCRVPRSIWNDTTARNQLSSLTVDTIAANCGAACDVIEIMVTGRIQPGVHEAQSRETFLEPSVVEKTDDGSPDR